MLDGDGGEVVYGVFDVIKGYLEDVVVVLVFCLDVFVEVVLVDERMECLVEFELFGVEVGNCYVFWCFGVELVLKGVYLCGLG